jgi:hypothetical protein
VHCWKYTGTYKKKIYSFKGVISTYGGYFIYFSKLGFPGKVHDKKMWDQENLSSFMLPDEYGIADKGYEGVAKLLTPWKGKKADLNKKQRYVFHIIS